MWTRRARDVCLGIRVSHIGAAVRVGAAYYYEVRNAYKQRWAPLTAERGSPTNETR